MKSAVQVLRRTSKFVVDLIKGRNVLSSNPLPRRLKASPPRRVPLSAEPDAPLECAVLQEEPDATRKKRVADERPPGLSWPAGVYSLPWQVGRTITRTLSVLDLPQRYAGWVYAAVRAISQGCAASDIFFRAGGGGWRRSPPERDVKGRTTVPLSDQHPLALLFRHVNPMHTYRELIERTVMDLELGGNAFWVLCRRRVSGVPAEIWPVPAVWMRVVPLQQNARGPRRIRQATSHGGQVPSSGSYRSWSHRGGAPGSSGSGGRNDADAPPLSYRLVRAGREYELDARDVVHFRYPSPDNPYYGASPLRAALDAVYADESLARAQRRTFENGPMPGVVLKTREDLTREQRERLRAEFESGFAGPDRAGRLIITGRGSDVVPFTTSPREMDFLQSARVTRDRILGVFGVPPAVLGLVEDFNRANAEAAQMLFARDTLQPKVKLLAARITQDVCSQFLGPDGSPNGITCEFDSPVPQDREADRRDMEAGVRLGVVSPNEARADYYGKEPLEGLDTPRPLNVSLPAERQDKDAAP